jgi:hypothetical protein
MFNFQSQTLKFANKKAAYNEVHLFFYIVISSEVFKLSSDVPKI